MGLHMNPDNRWIKLADRIKGTLTIDANCAPANIRYPQDISLLNEAREKLETIIYRFCKSYGLRLPRRYRKQLGYVKRDLRYLEQFMSDGYAMTGKAIDWYLTIIKLYEQQQYMYANRVHSVEHRIVSISQPWLRPIVRGKVKVPVEFGEKFDLSLDSEGYGRIEKISFEAYNESTCLIEAVERFKERTRYYPVRSLADQIYRTRENRHYCKEHGYGYQVQSWADQVLQQKWIKNKCIRIIPIESK